MSSQISKKIKSKSTDIVFIIISILTTSLVVYNAFQSTLSTLLIISVYTLLIVILLSLLYIALEDFKTMEIDNWLSLSLMFTLLVLNLYLHFSGYQENGLVINENFSYLPYNNFYLALLLGFVSFSIVLLTKEKALGSGDIRIAIVVGLLIGKDNLLIWLYSTILSALVYGVIVGYKKKSFKKLKIPFTPFMIISCIIVLLIDLYF